MPFRHAFIFLKICYVLYMLSICYIQGCNCCGIIHRPFSTFSTTRQVCYKVHKVPNKSESLPASRWYAARTPPRLGSWWNCDMAWPCFELVSDFIVPEAANLRTGVIHRRLFLIVVAECSNDCRDLAVQIFKKIDQVIHLFSISYFDVVLTKNLQHYQLELHSVWLENWCEWNIKHKKIFSSLLPPNQHLFILPTHHCLQRTSMDTSSADCGQLHNSMRWLTRP